MNSVFAALPGIEVPVGEMRRALERLWESDAPAGQGAVSEFRASQMNFVVHFGLPSTPEDALEQFAILLRFAQRYPCRIIALVPLQEAEPGAAMRAKLYSQCYIGRTRTEMSCTEVLILAYPQETREFVADEVSTLVESDLPIYYWAHRFSACAKIARYQYLLRSARRFILDSAIVPEDALDFPWPRPEALRDLAAARLLPLRQAIGRFLSGFAPAQLGGAHDGVEVRAGAGVRAEGRALLNWAHAALAQCGAGDPPARLLLDPAAHGGDRAIDLSFHYRDGRHFRWQADLAAGTSQFDADFGGGPIRAVASVNLLAPEAALGEAIFS